MVGPLDPVERETVAEFWPPNALRRFNAWEAEHREVIAALPAEAVRVDVGRGADMQDASDVERTRTARALAALDRQVMQQALWAPYFNRQQTDFFGSDVDMTCYVNHVLFLFEWAHICKKS